MEAIKALSSCLSIIQLPLDSTWIPLEHWPTSKGIKEKNGSGDRVRQSAEHKKKTHKYLGLKLLTGTFLFHIQYGLDSHGLSSLSAN